MNLKEVCQGFNLENEHAIGFFGVDEKYNIITWSNGCKSFFLYTKEEIIGKSIFDTIIPQYSKESFKDDLQRQTIFDFEQIEFTKKDKSSIYLNTSIRYYQKHILFFLTPYIKNKKSIISTLTQKFNKNIVISLDRNGYIKEFNHQASLLTGYNQSEVIDRNFIELFVPESHKEKVFEQIQNSFRKKESMIENEFPIICKNKSRKIVHFNFKLFNRRHKDWKLSLISEYKIDNLKHQQMHYLATYDILTDLPNINLFKSKLEEEMYQISKNNTLNLLLIYLDIKNFNVINHTLGTQIGDILLQMIAKKLYSRLRDYDIVARVGSNRFALLFNKLPDEIYASKIVDRVLALFEEPFEIDSSNIKVDVYIGATLYPSDGNSVDKLISNAELALSKAKKSSKSDYKFFVPSMYDEVAREHTIRQSIQEALKNDQFYVVYQPQVETNTKKIVGVEALVRWEHPQLKNIPPLDFIPIAEDNGLILEIGKLVLEKSIKSIKILHNNGWKELNLSVNISAIQLLQSDLVQTIKNLLKKYDFNPSNLHLELTESVFMQNLDLSKNVLNEFKNLGVKISIDDFGTGYSSLSYISKLPIDFVKIDQSFIDDIVDNKNYPIIDAIISMAHALDIKVVAEGVENIEQYKYLKRKKCDFIQGYYFSKPLSYKKLHSYIDSNQININNKSNSAKIDDIAKVERVI